MKTANLEIKAHHKIRGIWIVVHKASGCSIASVKGKNNAIALTKEVEPLAGFTKDEAESGKYPYKEIAAITSKYAIKF